MTKRTNWKTRALEAEYRLHEKQTALEITYAAYRANEKAYKESQEKLSRYRRMNAVAVDALCEEWIIRDEEGNVDKSFWTLPRERWYPAQHDYERIINLLGFRHDERGRVGKI